MPFNEEEDGREHVRDGVRQVEGPIQFLPRDDETDEEEEGEEGEEDEEEDDEDADSEARSDVEGFLEKKK